MLSALTALLLLLTQGRALALFWVLEDAGNSFSAFKATMVVPQQPVKPGSYFIWLGLESTSSSANYKPVGNGVLQPVLTFGHSCAPNTDQIANPNGTWYVSGLYVNLGQDNNFPEAFGCKGGNVMDVMPGDHLVSSITRMPGSSIWVQTITNKGKACQPQSGGVPLSKNGKDCSVQFSYDMMNQAQTFAILEVELLHNATVDFNVEFRDILLSTDTRDSSVDSGAFCSSAAVLGTVEKCSDIKLREDGLLCKVHSCVFQASRVNPITETVRPASKMQNAMVVKQPTKAKLAELAAAMAVKFAKDAEKALKDVKTSAVKSGQQAWEAASAGADAALAEVAAVLDVKKEKKGKPGRR
ncbi:hypothetical protein HDU77_006720 [Chytriomyces hyalinus]|nr:hypothetical protein HDU77_006720 [Chytriomyces hyalinus]